MMHSDDTKETNPILGSEYGTSTKCQRWSEKLFFYLREHKKQLWSTLNVYFSYIAFAGLYTVIGPSLPDLQLIVGVDLSTASWIFTCTSFGYMMGCGLHGILQNRLHISLLMTIYSLLAGVLWIVTPWCSLLWLMLIVRTAGGISSGCMDSVVHERLFSIWGLEAGPYSQAMYFMLGFGGVCSSLVVGPFVLPEKTMPMLLESNATVSSIKSNVSSLHDLLTSTNVLALQRADTKIHIPYLIVGCVAILSGMTSLFEYVWTISCQPKEEITQITKASDQVSSRNRSNKYTFLTAMAILSVMNLLITGLIDTYIGFFSSYLINQLHWSPPNGAFGTSVFFIAFTAGNILAMCSTLFVTTRVLISTSVLMSIGFFVGLIISGYCLSDAGTYICTVGLGLCLSPQWPALFTFIEEEISPITGKLASLILFTGAIGLCFNPLLVGKTMASMAPIAFGYIMLTELSICFILYLAVFYLTRKHKDDCLTPYDGDM